MNINSIGEPSARVIEVATDCTALADSTRKHLPADIHDRLVAMLSGLIHEIHVHEECRRGSSAP